MKSTNSIDFFSGIFSEERFCSIKQQVFPNLPVSRKKCFILPASNNDRKPDKIAW
jgi:hypothetical protein